MHELLIYLGLSIISILLFTFWFARQGKVSERKWLLAKLNSVDDDKQKEYVSALQNLKHQPTKIISTTVLIGLMIIPATFAIDYLWFHEIPIEQRVSVTAENEAPDLVTAIAQLEQKLVDDPNDLEGQLLYGRSMMSMQNYPKAVAAYKRANEIDPNKADILTELAEAIAFNNNTGSFLGEPEIYLKQAIQINPKFQKAMWLQGIVYYENQQFEAAEAIWTELLAIVETPNIKSTIIKQINMARTALNKPVLDPNSPTDNPSTSAVEYFVVVNINESINNIELSDNSRLFIYAKEINGPPMPIAAIPVSAPFNWPISVKISDLQNLNPERKLSGFEQVEFSAKLSLTGNATPAVDDVFSNTLIANPSNPTIQLILTQ